MTAPRTRTADALDVALALANPAPRPPRSPEPQAGHDPAASADPEASASAAAVPWDEARRIAADAGRDAARHAEAEAEDEVEELPLPGALGRRLAAPLEALSDLPAFDTAAMDGWAVAGPGPWRLAGSGAALTAGRAPRPLPDGRAVAVATGARLPAGATAVLRSEEGIAEDTAEDGARLRARHRDPDHGRDIRLRGSECRAGEQLLPAGTRITPAVLGLAASAGHDALAAPPLPSVALLVLGDELLVKGRPTGARVRDALGPLLTAWLPELGAEAIAAPRRVKDDPEALREALAGAAEEAEVVVTTGGTAAGPRDFLHAVLADLDAELLVDGVDVRPGHPMLLARLPHGAHLVGLPGNPLAAVAGVLTLLAPLLAARNGTDARPDPEAPLVAEVPGSGSRTGTRLLPAALGPHGLEPLRYHGSAQLRSLALADAFAVVPAAGAPAGAAVPHLPLRWGAA
ncbi:hypothetical protein BIV57_07040 [Mangrovactinospora gilvigrisea]|uniref:Molybdopterin molybdenumtransferase n=1 Tax=Mangrovactinospora gilvigrisea TaxID=1428644 RepID=A0A1J7C9I4_9ACTN|nr:molybdopterin molybdotransferase MoeA [Mangrovactinospora gilvigrisea]OIV38192.1 hypothetical protein BIV57_07040 [Mangrovactinospora gilvigrisea]